MSATYSTSQGVTYAEKLGDLQSVLNILPDNTQKLIQPRDVRDSIYTTWENIAFKPTKVVGSDLEYIGIDRKDLKSKVFFGKRNLGDIDIMTDTLLREDGVDYYFYNNKYDQDPNRNTKIVFLAGTTSFYYEGGLSAPFLESKVVQTAFDDNYLNFDIRNTSYIWDGFDRIGGDINIYSDKGHVTLNGIVLPKLGENNISSNNGKYLKFLWDGSGAGYASWSSIDSMNTSEIISTGTISITGDPVIINGLNVNFSETVGVPTAVGGIAAGSTFDNVPVTEVLRRLLYPYLEPSITTNFEYRFVESGNLTSLSLQKLFYTIQRPSTYSIISFSPSPPDLTPASPLLINPIAISQSQTQGYVQPLVNPYLNRFSGFSNFSFTLRLQDNLSTKTSTSVFTIVLPWYYGTSTVATSNVTNLNNILSYGSEVNKLSPLLKAQPTSGESVTVKLSTNLLSGGIGCVYFGYPSQYPDLSDIIDDNNYSVKDRFKLYTITGITSPQLYWGGPSENRQYKFYIYVGVGNEPTQTRIRSLVDYTFVFQ